jgi:SET domain-containing protein
MDNGRISAAKPYEVRLSPIAGDGVFAVRRIEAGERIGIAFMIAGSTGNPDRDISRTELGEKMNHADAPNVGLAKEANAYACIALRSIAAGQELLIDYARIPWEGKREF